MAVKNLHSIVLDFFPGKTIASCLSAINDLCQELDDAKATCLALYEQLDAIYLQLEAIEETGRLENELIDQFTIILQRYWGHLEAFRDMNVIARLLNHSKFKTTIRQLNDDIESPAQHVGLVNVQAQVQWQRQYEVAMRDQQEALQDILQHASDLQDDLRGATDKRDALILLRAEIEQIQAHKSSLSPDIQAIVKQAYRTVINLANIPVNDTPQWFLAESDVNYDIVPFAHGALGSVHKGTYHHTNVVVKFVRPTECGLDASLQQSFIQEINRWSDLKHPNVVQLIGACHVSRRPLLVYEAAAHGSMIDYLSLSMYHHNKMWRLLYEAAKGMEYLHRMNIVHGDVRLSNILVTQDHHAVVTDFGMSRVKRSSKIKCHAKRRDGSTILGNWRWMAPESFTSMPQMESDVYGLGMTILEAFNGEPPFAEVVEEKDVKAMILKCALPPRPEGMSDRVWSLVDRMTKPKLDKRLKMRDVVVALEELAATEPVPPFETNERNTPPLPTPVPTSGDVTRMMNDLRNKDTAVEAALQLSAYTDRPPGARALCTSDYIHVLLSSLQDSTKAAMTEALAQTLANITKDETGSKIIGGRGGVMALVQLLNTGTNDRVKSIALAALVTLVKNPLNGKIFAEAGGIEALQMYIENESYISLVETLGFLKEIASSSTELTRAIAVNSYFISTCLSLMATGSLEERKAAGLLLRELAQTDAVAVQEIDKLNGFDSLMQLAKNDNTHAEETLLAGIERMLQSTSRITSSVQGQIEQTASWTAWNSLSRTSDWSTAMLHRFHQLTNAATPLR